MRSSHGGAAGKGITTVAGVAGRARVSARGSDVRFCAVAAIDSHWAAIAEAGYGICSGIQCSYRIGRRIPRRRP